MTNDELWKEFEISGKVSDYLRYAVEREIKGAETVDNDQGTCYRRT